MENMIMKSRQQIIRLTLVPTDYLFWMNDQLDQMIKDVKKANQELQNIRSVQHEQ